MARWKNIENYGKNLIKHFTGFREDEENFAICFEFVMSNFKYHKFLDVDEHQVKKIKEGIYEKFMIHCYNEKAEKFQNLCRTFLTSPVFEDNEKGNTTTHYAVLQLLLLLADSPTNSSVSASKEIETASVAKNDFDWGAYLLEGEEEVPSWVSDDESSLTSDDELTVSPSHAVAISSDNSSEQILKCTEAEGIQHHSCLTLPSKTDVSEDLYCSLAEDLIQPYWIGESLQQDLSSCRSSRMRSDWEDYLFETCPVYSSSNVSSVSEYQIIREILWLLCGCDDLFIFCWTGDLFEPNKNIAINHLTDDALHSCLCYVAHFGTVVRHLNEYIDFVSNRRSMRSSDPSDFLITQTHQAFGMALSQYLQQMSKFIVDIESIVRLQNETTSLSSVLEMLSPILKDLDTLDSLFSESIKSFIDISTKGVNGVVSCGTSAAKLTCHLLNRVFFALMQSDQIGKDSQKVLQLILPIWLMICQPYINIIDDWMHKGLLNDPFREFIICRNTEVQSLNENFWDQAFCLEGFTGDAGNLKRINAHVFLGPVLREIILTGKSMELLESLGRLKDVTSNSTSRTSLYDMYVDSFLDHLRSKDRMIETDSEEVMANETCCVDQAIEIDQTSRSGSLNRDQTLDEYIEHQLNEPTISDGLLRLNFQQLLKLQVPKTAAQKFISKKLVGIVLDSIQPIHLTMHSCLYSHIVDQYRLVSSNLLRILKDDFKLMDYISGLRHFFLMESGNTMFDFYTSIFEKISHKEFWQDASFLNMTLQESLHCDHPADVDKLSITVDPSVNSTHLLTVMNSVSMHYKVPWPVNIVINARSLAVYNQIFQFLLQIKWVKYALDELRFPDLNDRKCATDEMESTSMMADAHKWSRNELVHRIQIFRMKILHFVNSLNNYIMTRILHSVCLEFQTEMETACDLDQVIAAHNAYVKTIHERCLLHKKVAFIKDMISRVLQLGLSVQNLWNHSNVPLSPSMLLDMEKEFSRCVQFLSSMITQVTSRGSFPHLESLAFALVTCSEASQPLRTGHKTNAPD